jgi:acetyl-CoA acetyltransferase
MSLKGKAAVIGFAEMTPQKGGGGKTPLGIIGEVSRDAIADAGLKKQDIDGLLTGMAIGDYSVLWPSVISEYLQFHPRYFDLVELGGASATGMFWRAAAAIEAGMCKRVVRLGRFVDEQDDERGKTAAVSASGRRV